ncbi:MAG: NAD(+) synthase, partial [Oscillospiraceae bacterium]
ISKGFVGGFESGNKILFKSSLTNECVSVFDIDCDTLPVKNNLYDISFSKECNKKDYLMRQISKTPYLPTEEYKRSAYFKDLFALQSNALARRLKNINISKAVIGISGGLDSTIALLCVKNAFDILDIPSQNIIAVTMQGMGTTKSTFENAIALMEGLNCTIKNIPIKDAVLQHFLDIGHDPDIKDVTYENAQARERTQILFDIANKENAIVVGTGDLSEAMLGFCTFGGDNLSSFNVNGSLLKTVIRMLVQYLSENEFSFIGDILNDILNTPISPELLPADEEGNIAQKTENILGKYILHDFFIYYFVKYNFSKEKLFEYANCAFSNDFSREYIYEKLNIFFDRFTKSQFKRSCCSEFTRLNDYCTYNLPSDMKNIF